MIYYVVLGLVVNLILAATSSEKTASIHIPIKGGNIIKKDLNRLEKLEKENQELKEQVNHFKKPLTKMKEKKW